LGQEIKRQRVIKTGLTKDDRVIVDGLQRVKPGITVSAEMRPPAKPPESPLSKLLNSVRTNKSAPAETKKPASGAPVEAPGRQKNAQANNANSQVGRPK